MTFADAVAQLEEGLRRELPGPQAQDWLSPIPRRQWPSGFNPARVRHAAGLLLVFPGDVDAELAEPAEEIHSSETKNSLRSPRPLRSIRPAHVVLTVRSDNVRHGGQVSLPGGVVEPGETLEQAALREAHEEVALPLEGVRVIGALTPLDIHVSGFRLHPIVAVTNTRPTLTPADAEVAHILEVGVDDLLDPAALADTTLGRDGNGAGRIPRVAGLDGPGNGLTGCSCQFCTDWQAVCTFKRSFQQWTTAELHSLHAFSDNACFGSARYDARLSGAGTS